MKPENRLASYRTIVTVIIQQAGIFVLRILKTEVMVRMEATMVESYIRNTIGPRTRM